eukprot:1480160-Prymnesium_polylepis.1
MSVGRRRTRHAGARGACGEMAGARIACACCVRVGVQGVSWGVFGGWAGGRAEPGRAAARRTAEVKAGGTAAQLLDRGTDGLGHRCGHAG